MKKYFFISLFLPFVSFSQNLSVLFPVIPKPVELIADTGVFIVTEKTRLIVPQFYMKSEADFLADRVEKLFGIKLKISNEIPGNGNYILLQQIDTDSDVGDYNRLVINKSSVSIYGEANEGVFWGIQSFLQLIYEKKPGTLLVPNCRIYDYPRFSWRGMHLDVCRHFFSKEEIKKYLDDLALYKFNVFHWHLTEDQGWRIEIKKYPKLTATGSIRKQTIIGKQSDSASFDQTPYGGFYTQEDIKEIVAYATVRHITVVPEIEMPGHSQAALSAYPEYSCSGGPFEVGTRWGVYDDVYCAGNDSTFIFLENILSEVCDLFPGKYIHVGGDECPKTRWEKCRKCQRRIYKEHLKDEHELQSYFIRRIEKFLNTKGKQIIGWDEILEGGLAPNAAVMSWRGSDGGIAAAKQKHAVVMSPGKPCYFDHYQSREKEKEPLAIGGFNPLDSVYNYDPLPKELSSEENKFILGAQGNVWTEYITTFRQVEYMSVPRMCALSEALWTGKEKKNYADFVLRLKINVPLLDKMNVNYAKHFLH